MAASTTTAFRGRIDFASVAMAAVTVAALLGAAWYRSGASLRPTPLAVGDLAPPLHLLDLNTAEPLVLAGPRGNVVWVVFWSADSPAGRSSLALLERTWSQLKTHRRFTLVTAAAEADQSARVRAVVAQNAKKLPVYLADPDTRRHYGALRPDPPLHILIDTNGRIMALARGAGRQTIERFADLARSRLEELDPLGATRFASARGPDVLPSRP